MSQSLRVLITGGTGILGSHLTDRLLAGGHAVVVFASLLTGRADNLAHRFGHEHFRFVKQDVTRYLHLPGRLDAVVHFASPASPIDYLRMPIPTLKVGSLGTHKALGLSLAKRARKVLVLTGSISRIEHRRLTVDDPNVRRPDISSARRLLGWEPRLPLEEGLERTIPCFRESLGLER